MAGCMYQNYGHSKLLPLLRNYSATDVSGVIAGTSNPLYQSLSPEVKAVVIENIVQVMSYIWAVMIAGAAINVVLGPFLGVEIPVHSADGASLEAMLTFYQRKKIYAFPPGASASEHQHP